MPAPSLVTVRAVAHSPRSLVTAIHPEPKELRQLAKDQKLLGREALVLALLVQALPLNKLDALLVGSYLRRQFDRFPRENRAHPEPIERRVSSGDAGDQGGWKPNPKYQCLRKSAHSLASDYGQCRSSPTTSASSRAKRSAASTDMLCPAMAMPL